MSENCPRVVRLCTLARQLRSAVIDTRQRLKSSSGSSQLGMVLVQGTIPKSCSLFPKLDVTFCKIEWDHMGLPFRLWT